MLVLFRSLQYWNTKWSSIVQYLYTSILDLKYTFTKFGPSIGEYWNIFGVPELPENVIFMFFRTCWSYSEAYSTGTQNGLVLSNTCVPVSWT